MDNQADIFLCHSSKDKEFVRRLAQDLKELGITAWVDEWMLEPGDSLLDRIGKALENSIYVGVVISKNAVNSIWYKKELNQALTREFRSGYKIIVPILLDETRLPAFLEEKLYLDFTHSYFESLARLSGMIHALDPGDISRATTEAPPKSISDIRLIYSKAGDDVDKLSDDEHQYARLRRLAKARPTVENLLTFGRVCFELKKDAEAKSAFQSALAADPDFLSIDNISKTVESSAKEQKPFVLKTSSRVALSYLGLLHDDEDSILNSSYDSDDKEVLVNAGKFYLNTHNADIPCAIAYFIKATESEPAASIWVQHCDALIHRILSDKSMIYPTISWDFIERSVQEWNSHRWKLV